MKAKLLLVMLLVAVPVFTSAQNDPTKKGYDPTTYVKMVDTCTATVVVWDHGFQYRGMQDIKQSGLGCQEQFASPMKYMSDDELKQLEQLLTQVAAALPSKTYGKGDESLRMVVYVKKNTGRTYRVRGSAAVPTKIEEIQEFLYKLATKYGAR